MRHLPAILVVILILFFGGVLLWRAQPRATWHTYRTFAFNTDCWLKIYCASTARANAAASECLALLTALHLDLNCFSETSAVSQFNQAPAGTPFPCNRYLWAAFDAARQAYEETDGAFDVTIGPLMAYWRAVAKGEQEADENVFLGTRARVGFNKLAFDDKARTVTKTVEGMSVDFGGLAKGLALDIVREQLKLNGLVHFQMNFGGNLFLSMPEGEASTVAISDPREEGKLLYSLKDCNDRFVATSSDAHRALAPGKVSHVIDPRTGQPAEALLSATAATIYGSASDYLSTAVFVGGVEMARKLAEIRPTTFVLLDRNGELHLISTPDTPPEPPLK